MKRDQIGPEGQPIGSYTHDDNEVDDIARRAWGNIYQGNFINLREEADAFIKDYSRYIYKGPKFKMGK